MCVPDIERPALGDGRHPLIGVGAGQDQRLRAGLVQPARAAERPLDRERAVARTERARRRQRQRQPQRLAGGRKVDHIALQRHAAAVDQKRARPAAEEEPAEGRAGRQVVGVHHSRRTVEAQRVTRNGCAGVAVPVGRRAPVGVRATAVPCALSGRDRRRCQQRPNDHRVLCVHGSVPFIAETSASPNCHAAPSARPYLRNACRPDIWRRCRPRRRCRRASFFRRRTASRPAR